MRYTVIGVQDQEADTTLDEIENDFGLKIRKLVAEFTESKEPFAYTTKQLQIVNARNLSYETKLIKLAEKIFTAMLLRNLMQRGLTVGWTNVIELARLLNAEVDDLRGTNSDMEYFFDYIYNQIESNQKNSILKNYNDSIVQYWEKTQHDDL